MNSSPDKPFYEYIKLVTEILAVREASRKKLRVVNYDDTAAEEVDIQFRMTAIWPHLNNDERDLVNALCKALQNGGAI